MERSCPYCKHCQNIDMLHKIAIEREREEDEARKREEKRREKKWQEDKEKGIIYGERYWLYDADEIRNITDTDFLVRMRVGIWPAGQPQQEDYDYYVNLSSVISQRLSELHKWKSHVSSFYVIENKVTFIRSFFF